MEKNSYPALIQFQFDLSQVKIAPLTEVMQPFCEAIWYNEHNICGLVNTAIKKDLKRLIETWCRSQNIDLPKIKFFPMEIQDWLEKSQKELPSISIGKYAFYQHGNPSPSGKHERVFELEFSHAFGSGHHVTTQMCIEAIESLSKAPIKKALDFGCGSGILSLIIDHRFHNPILACDNDPESLKATQKNAAFNNISTIETLETDTLNHPAIQNQKPFDLIIANVPMEVLCSEASHMRQILHPKGIVILSGFLVSQEEKILKAYQFAHIVRREAADWILLMGSYDI